MNPRRVLTAVGAGLTTFLLVAVLVIELLAFEFSGIIGLPVGLLAGVAAFAVLWSQLDDLSLGIRRAASAYAAFGLTILLQFALSYVNIGRDIFSLEVMTGVAVGGAILVYCGLWLVDSGRVRGPF